MADTTTQPERPVFLYPDPLTLARSRAEAEVRVMADRLTYSDMCRNWGRVGGMTTAKRYGSRFYSLLARIRHGDTGAALELALHLDARRSG